MDALVLPPHALKESFSQLIDLFLLRVIVNQFNGPPHHTCAEPLVSACASNVRPLLACKDGGP